jgi:serine O-acetyltransferase
MISERSNALVGEAALPPHEGLLTSIREDIGCVRTRDPAARGRLESLLIYPGVHAVIWHRIAHRLWNGNAKSAARFVSWI